MSIVNNRWGKIYHSLIQNARNQNRSKKDAYFENHHILPRSMGGTNQKTNLVLLTAREHYVAHLLLVRCVDRSQVYKMTAALARFRKQAQNGRSYQLFRETLSRYGKGEFNSSYGKIWIHNKNNLDIRYIPKTELDSLDSSWVKGLPYQRGGYTSDYVWLHKEDQRTVVLRNQAASLQKQGWKLGRNVIFEAEHYIKMSAARHTPEKDKAHSQKLQGKVAMRRPDETSVIRIDADQVAEYERMGFIQHRGSGMKMITSAGRPCSIEGQVFDSVSKASKILQMEYQSIIRKIKSIRFPDYYYL